MARDNDRAKRQVCGEIGGKKMNYREAFFGGFIAISVVSSQWTGAQTQAPAPTENIKVPDGYGKLFEEIATAMRKYPGAAARFTIRDRKASTARPGPVTPLSDPFACCVRHGSDCAEWCLE
jgi:hypothetical protein